MPAKSPLIIGLDIGGTTSKVAAISGQRQLTAMRVQASDPLSSAYGALGRFISANELELSAIDSVVVTGVGQSLVTGTLFNLPTVKCPEFEAVARGGLYLAEKERAIVVSMGTGSSIVLGEGEQYEHIIGSGVGGGTVTGLGKLLLQVYDFASLEALAMEGSLQGVDLTVGDLSAEAIANLPPETTAANFAAVDERAPARDLARGLMNLVFQSLGTAAILAARLKNCQDIVFIGSLAKSKVGQASLERFSDLYDVEISVPDQAEFATALGAALSDPRAARGR